jgi:FMN phosphatase YigB (HAD superfamily)
LEKAGCSVEEVIYVGDNLERDVMPAQAMGVRCILFSAQAPNIPVPRITTLRTIEANLDAIISSSQKSNQVVSFEVS